MDRCHYTAYAYARGGVRGVLMLHMLEVPIMTTCLGVGVVQMFPAKAELSFLIPLHCQIGKKIKKVTMFLHHNRQL